MDVVVSHVASVVEWDYGPFSPPASADRDLLLPHWATQLNSRQSAHGNSRVIHMEKWSSTKRNGRLQGIRNGWLCVSMLQIVMATCSLQSLYLQPIVVSFTCWPYNIKGIVRWKMKIHSLSTPHYADGGVGQNTSQNTFGVSGGKQCCSWIHHNSSKWDSIFRCKETTELIATCLHTSPVVSSMCL